MNPDISNFPVKFAVLPIYRLDNCVPPILGYIVSMVFLIQETTVHSYYGTHTEYFIVPPVKGIQSFESSASIRKPIYNKQNICTNQERAQVLYDTYYEAKIVCNEFNDKLYRAQYSYQNYDAWRQYYQNFEDQVKVKCNKCGLVSKNGYDVKITR